MTQSLFWVVAAVADDLSTVLSLVAVGCLCHEEKGCVWCLFRKDWQEVYAQRSMIHILIQRLLCPLCHSDIYQFWGIDQEWAHTQWPSHSWQYAPTTCGKRQRKLKARQKFCVGAPLMIMQCDYVVGCYACPKHYEGGVRGTLEQGQCQSRKQKVRRHTTLFFFLTLLLGRASMLFKRKMA